MQPLRTCSITFSKASRVLSVTNVFSTSAASNDVRTARKRLSSSDGCQTRKCKELVSGSKKKVKGLSHTGGI